MAKILLVEDDNNLREIYEARLMAEGYDIVAARDGEEALTVAIKEKPDLIISDVMMPKISGFDMLDILRSTPETKDCRVIMMTALSQAEDKARAEKLGADRYLVKSQVTLEDVAKVAKEVLEGGSAPAPAAAAPVATTPVAAPAVVQSQPMQPQPAVDPSQPVQAAPVAPATAAPVTPTPATTPVAAPAVVPQPVAAAPVTVAAAAAAAVTPEEPGRKKVIAPLNNMAEVDGETKLKTLLQKEKAKEEMAETVKETLAAHAPPPVVPSRQADAATAEAPVQPPAPQSTIDPNSIAL